MVTWCSWRSLAEAEQRGGRGAASAVGVAPRGASVPAIGWARTTSPWRPTSSSGLAPTKPSTENRKQPG